MPISLGGWTLKQLTIRQNQKNIFWAINYDLVKKKSIVFTV